MTFRERILVLFLLPLCWAGLCLNAQPAQLDFRQYTTDDGLPSSETYIIVEDRSGYVWIGTDNGVARFDGYEFEVFDADDGLEDMVVFGIVEDDKGMIWISTLSGKLYFFEDGQFHPFAHNGVFEKTKYVKHLSVLIDVLADGSFILSFPFHGFLKVSPSGATEWLVGHNEQDIYLYESMVGGRLTSIPRPHGFFHINLKNYKDSLKLFLLNGNGTRPYSEAKTYPVGSSRSSFSAVFTANGKTESVIANANEVFILNENGSFKHTFPSSPNGYNYFMPGLDTDTYWAFLKSGGGLEYHDFRNGKTFPKTFRQLFGHSLSSGMFDKNGGFWASSHDAGIFYCPYPQQLIYSKDDESKNGKAISIVLTSPRDFYAGYGDGTIFQYVDNSNSLQHIQEDELVVPGRLFDMYYDSINARVLSPSYSFSHPIQEGEKLNATTVNWFHDKKGMRRKFNFFNELSDMSSRKIYGSYPSWAATIDLDSGGLVEINVEHQVLAGIAHVYGKHPDGTRLIGSIHGLKELKDDGSLVPNDLGVPELSNRVVFIKDLGYDQLLFGTRGDGLVYMGLDTTYLIRERDGLASNMIRDIHVSDNGTIWISTLNGLSRLNLLNGGKDYKLRTFGKEHGLPSSEVYQTDTYGSNIWLATSAGVVKFEEPLMVTNSQAPVIRSVVLNGDKMPDTSAYALPSGSQDVSIDFSTINFILGDEVLYRYRLNDSSPWKYSRERTANYPNLGAGTYRFAVQSKNQDGVWSESTMRTISVATPWYKTIWTLIGGILLFGALLSSFFLLRERRKKREQDFISQITQLEHAALHAQMNPHFVFNALNSIQNFVLQNDAKQAATYLARFARVIRQTLRSSVDGRHSLSDELMMLETYLGLEKLRFKEGFSFTIEIDPLLPRDEVILPPLLIQPFVENAIIHGLKDRKAGGQISVRFAGTAENLVVVIEDNGIGYSAAESNKPDSLGMGITRRRLNLMNLGKDGASGMEIDPLFSDTGVLSGTRVTLFIRPLSSPAPAAAAAADKT